jgi:hypothetical protein
MIIPKFALDDILNRERMVDKLNKISERLQYWESLSAGPPLGVQLGAIAPVITMRRQPGEGGGRVGASRSEFPAKITDSTYSGTYHAYEYEWVEAYRNPLGTDGYDTFIAKPGGRNSDDDGLAHNAAEYNFSHITRTFQTQPVEDGALVWLHEEVEDEWWFDRDVNSEMGDTPNGSVSLGSGTTVVSSTTDNTTFDYDDDDGKSCTEIYLTGVYYNATTFKFFVKYRARTSDAGGRLLGVSAEAAAEVVALVECEPEV